MTYKPKHTSKATSQAAGQQSRSTRVCLTMLVAPRTTVRRSRKSSCVQGRSGSTCRPPTHPPSNANAPISYPDAARALPAVTCAASARSRIPSARGGKEQRRLATEPVARAVGIQRSRAGCAVPPMILPSWLRKRVQSATSGSWSGDLGRS